MSRVYNFSPGPAALPEEVLKEVQEELLNWHRMGMSIIEIPHRGNDFIKLAKEAEQDLRDLLHISNDYKVLFLQGGARLHFAAIPMNLWDDYDCVSYVNTGVWSESAINEAKRYGRTEVVASAHDQKYVAIPDINTWRIPTNAAYLHYVDNETVNGVEFPFIPDSKGLTLISDMSSNFLSRPFDLNKFGLVYAGAQKNIGPAGLVIVVVHQDLLKRKALPITPQVINYAEQAKNDSMINTPPTFAWYVASLVFKWIKNQGGVEAMGKLNQRKADKLYQYIDQSDFYHNPIKTNSRSRMNIPFTLADDKLDAAFLTSADAAGLANLKGHRIVGGMRASIYNAMPEKGVDMLIEFMREFARRC